MSLTDSSISCVIQEAFLSPWTGCHRKGKIKKKECERQAEVSKEEQSVSWPV